MVKAYSSSDSAHFSQIMQSILQIAHAPSALAAIHAAELATRPLGLSTVIVIGAGDGPDQNEQSAIIASNVPALASSNKLIANRWHWDFASLAHRHRAQPWYWPDRSPQADIESPLDRMLTIAPLKRLDLRQGLIVPVFGILGYRGSVIFLGAQVDGLLDDLLPGMRSIALALIESLCDSNIAQKTQAELATIRLTRREIECLQWVSNGKTDREIAEKLAIAESTVHFHVENAKRKFNSTSRVRVVILALALGLIGIRD